MKTNTNTCLNHHKNQSRTKSLQKIRAGRLQRKQSHQSQNDSGQYLRGSNAASIALGALHSRAPKAIPSTIVINHPQEAVQRCELMDAFVSGDIDAAKVSRLGGLLLLFYG